MMPYERPNIASMSGYVPGEQPTSPDVVKLNTNENPYPPSDAVMNVLRAFPAEKLRRYPPPTARRFCHIAAEAHGVDPANVIATNGGDELLRLLITTFVPPGAPLGVDDPSYSLYPVLAEVNDSPVIPAPLGEDWSLPADYADRMLDAGVRLAFIVSPHAPSGRLQTVDRLAAIADRLRGRAVLVIDEAYVDFVDPDRGHDAVELVRRFDNVVLLRSLSKGYALAGLRFGYGLGAAGLIEPMTTKTKDSYPTDAIAQALACAALENRDAAADTWAKVRAERQRLSDALDGLGLAAPASESNFILPTVPGDLASGGGVAEVYERLKQRGILVRYFNHDRLRDKLRITIGTPDENNALLEALRESH